MSSSVAGRGNILQAFASMKLGRRITSCEELEAFRRKTTAYPQVGEILEDLRISINGLFPVPMLQSCFRSVPNLVDLDLLLSNPDTPGLLVDIQIDTLRFFRTNVHHQYLVPFFIRHPDIVIVDLDECGMHDVDCPLLPQFLPHVRSISGPARCVSRIVNGSCSRVTLRSSQNRASPVTLLRSVRLRLSSVSALTLDFFADEHDILTNVIKTCPNVAKLKLLEKPSRIGRHNSNRRAWNDARSWSKTLSLLPYLEELMLRTAATFVRKPHSQDEERRVVARWINGVYSATRGRPRPHPMLYHVGVWYSAEDATRGIVTHWSRVNGFWERTASVIHPALSYDFF